MEHWRCTHCSALSLTIISPTHRIWTLYLQWMFIWKRWRHIEKALNEGIPEVTNSIGSKRTKKKAKTHNGDYFYEWLPWLVSLNPLIPDHLEYYPAPDVEKNRPLTKQLHMQVQLASCNIENDGQSHAKILALDFIVLIALNYFCTLIYFARFCKKF